MKFSEITIYFASGIVMNMWATEEVVNRILNKSIIVLNYVTWEGKKGSFHIDFNGVELIKVEDIKGRLHVFHIADLGHYGVAGVTVKENSNKQLLV